MAKPVLNFHSQIVFFDQEKELNSGALHLTGTLEFDPRKNPKDQGVPSRNMRAFPCGTTINLLQKKKIYKSSVYLHT